MNAEVHLKFHGLKQPNPILRREQGMHAAGVQCLGPWTGGFSKPACA